MQRGKLAHHESSSTQQRTPHPRPMRRQWKGKALTQNCDGAPTGCSVGLAVNALRETAHHDPTCARDCGRESPSHASSVSGAASGAHEGDEGRRKNSRIAFHEQHRWREGDPPKRAGVAPIDEGYSVGNAHGWCARAKQTGVSGANTTCDERLLPSGLEMLDVDEPR